MDEDLRDFLVTKKLSGRASEDKFRIVFDNANDAIFIHTFDGLMLEVNQTACERLGYSKEELLKMTPTDLDTPEYGEIYNKRVEKLQEKGSFIFETAHVCKDGTIILIEASSKIILYEGQPAIMSVARDITERKRLEAAHRSLIDNSLQGLVIMVPFRIVFANQTFADISGYTIDELLNLSSYKIMKLVHPDDQKLVWGRLKERLDGETVPNHYIFRGIRKNGELRWLELYGTSIEYKGQQAIQGTFIDITDRKIAEQKLRESEEKYRLMSENVNDIIGILNRNFEIEYINEKATMNIGGYNLDEVIGKSGLLFVHPDDVERAMKSLKIGLEEGQSMEELRFRHKDGHYLWCEATGRIYTDNRDEIKGAVILRDITERKKAEQKLRDSEEKYRLITENSNDLIVVINENFEYEFINEEVHHRIMGYLKEDVIGKSSFSFVHPDDLGEATKTLKKGFKIGEGGGEARVRNKKGDYVWLEVKGRTFIDKDGKKKGLLISRDITDRKVTEQRLNESEEKYRLISENANDLIAMFNKKWRFVYINEDVHKRFLGYSKKNLIGKHLGLFIHPDDIRDVIDVIRENWKKGEGSANLRFKKIDGTYIWLEARGVTLRNANGELIGVTVSRDITERLEFEKKLEESEIKHHKAYNKITFYKDLFTHDINNLFQIINSSAELIENYCYNKTESEEIKNFTRTIKDQILKGAKLVKNIHLLSVLDEDFLKLRGVGVFRILNKSVDFIKNLDHKREIKIQIDFGDKKYEVQANKLLQEIFDNLLLNALKFNNNSIVEIQIKGSKVTRDNLNFIKMEFIDNGIGISDEKKKKIFEREYRRYKGLKGMGIGLSLVKKIIKKYKGKIWIEDKVKGDYSKGCKFILLIPEPIK